MQRERNRKTKPEYTGWNAISGNIVNIPSEKIFQGLIHFDGDLIHSIEFISENTDPALPYIIPGFTDSHVHIESSMLVPSEFARLAVVHGTVATVSDPHEIANVCGLDGVRFMIDNGGKVNFKFCFGAPSCVPATVFETSGAAIDAQGVRELLELSEIPYLSEMMNFPGVINEDPEVVAKIAAAKAVGKPVDGHAPGFVVKRCGNMLPPEFQRIMNVSLKRRHARNWRWA